MVLENVICMNAGDGETSYSSNSLLQKKVILKARPVLQESLKDYVQRERFDNCFKVADLGCSSGPNTLLAITDIIQTIYQWNQKMERKSPQFQFFLNDLPDNDFNNIFKKLPAYYDSVRKGMGEDFGPCFISGIPGSFYGRLFPSTSLHFIHSSYSLHWLSQVPEGIKKNKRNIYMANSSPPNVLKAYKRQFERDFSRFLHFRSDELVFGGRMVLTFIGRSSEDPTSKDCCYLLELLSNSILDLVAEGLVEEAALDSFNMPFYTPCQEEVKKIVGEEGSFDLDKLEIFEANWDPEDDAENNGYVFDKHQSGKRVASCIRAVMEPMLATHFGKTVMDNLFAKYAMHVGDHLCLEKTKYVNIVMSLTKKEVPKRLTDLFYEGLTTAPSQWA